MVGPPSSARRFGQSPPYQPPRVASHGPLVRVGIVPSPGLGMDLDRTRTWTGRSPPNRCHAERKTDLKPDRAGFACRYGARQAWIKASTVPGTSRPVLTPRLRFRAVTLWRTPSVRACGLPTSHGPSSSDPDRAPSRRRLHPPGWGPARRSARYRDGVRDIDHRWIGCARSDLASSCPSGPIGGSIPVRAGSRTCGDVWFRQGLVTGEREPRTPLGLVNQVAKRSTWQPPVDSRSRCLGSRVSVEAASASRVVEASLSGAAIRTSVT